MENKTLLGIFDSGVGGFSVLKEIRKITDADILYFGDCANAPYGNRGEEEIIVLIKSILTRLKNEGVTHFVSACNSMSVHTTLQILDEVGIPHDHYIDMVSAMKDIPVSKDMKVLIAGTRVTIASGVYQAMLQGSGIAVDTFSPHMLAGEVERNDVEAIKKSVTEVIEYARAVRATHILYACTHYPLVDELFKQVMAEYSYEGELIDPAVHVAHRVAAWNLTGARQIRFETSLLTSMFKEYSEKVW